MPNLRERLPDREQWILGIIPYAIIIHFLFRHGQFMKVVAWLARLASQFRPPRRDGDHIKAICAR
jgi:hypothetical protein